VPFIEDYLTYSSGNEAPTLFHHWASIATISATVGKRVWFTQGHWALNPNLYIIFVGNPANGKSTAMKIARGMVKKTKLAQICPASITKERMTELLAATESPCIQKILRPGSNGSEPTTYEFRQLSIFANELVTLLSVSGVSMIEFLTDVWDEDDDFEVQTKRSGNDFILHPYITLLGCMTPKITTSLLQQNIISGGLVRRCIFPFSQESREPIPFVVIEPEQYAAHDRCLKSLTRISEARGEFQFEPEARATFSAWYIKNKNRLNANPNLPFADYFQSKSELVIKLSMLLSLAESNSLLITTPHVTESLSLLSRTEKNLSKVFRDLGDNKQANLAEKIMEMLEGGPVLEKEIYRDLFNDGDRDTIDKTILHLIAIDNIKRVSKNNCNHLTRQ